MVEEVFKMERKKVRRRIKWNRIVGCAFMTVLVGVYSWMGASYIDVVTHNHNPNPVYQEWNFFELYMF